MDPNKPSQNTASESKGPQSNSNVNTSPNPARFASFTLLKDESGFRIPNCDHIFEFDIYGGWFDEYKNYYNADGEPQTPPEYDDDNVAGFDDDEAERLAREYDMGDEDEEEEHLAHYDNIYLNTENKRVLQNYLKDQEINIEVRNVNFNVKEDEFERFLVNKRIEWIDLEFEYDNRNRFKGVVYITIDKPNAEKLIEFNGQRTFGRDIKINVLRPDEEEDDAQAGGITAGETQEKQGTNASWRAQPTDKAPEAQGQGQPQTQSQKQGQPNPVPVSELEKNQSTQQQRSTGGFERTQIFNSNQNQSNMNNNQRNQGYGNQQNQNYGKGQQQSGYQNYGQKGQYQQGAIQRNTNFNSAQNQNQYQGNRQGSNYQGSRNQGYNPQYQMQGQGSYPYNAVPQQGSNAYMYPQQYSNYPQQWNQPYNQQSNGPFPGQFQPGHQGQNQNYQAPVNPGFEKNQIPPQNASAPKISGSQPQNQSGNSSASVQETQKVSDSQPQKQPGNSSAPVQETQKVSDSQPQKQPENALVPEVKTEAPKEDTAGAGAWGKKLLKKNKTGGK